MAHNPQRFIRVKCSSAPGHGPLRFPWGGITWRIFLGEQLAYKVGDGTEVWEDGINVYKKVVVEASD